MKRFLELTFVSLFNFLARLLKNRKWHPLNREEIRYFHISFSQFGEDLAVTRWARELGIENGRYLDIGAFHPIHMSNTLLFHQRGWRGVNIDMNPDKIRLFEKYRPEDDNIFCAISNDSQQFIWETKADQPSG